MKGTRGTIFTDASLRGWGTAWDGRVPAVKFFTANEKGSNINELKLTAALSTLRHFISFARKRKVELVIDSFVTSHIVRNMTSHSPRLLSKLRPLRQLCQDHGISLATRHRAQLFGGHPLPPSRLASMAASCGFRGPPRAPLRLFPQGARRPRSPRRPPNSA